MILLMSVFALVFLRSIQQQNVVGGHYMYAAITSYVIAFAEIGVILGIVKSGMDSVLLVGTGGALGVTAAMAVHRRFFKRL